MGVARIAILALAVVAAAFAALLVQGILGSKQKSAPAAAAKPDLAVTEVLVASKDLPLGHVVVASDMKWISWPEAALSPSYVAKKTSEGALQNMTGATVRQAMLAGEPVTQNKVVKSENAGFMAAMLSPGSRAVSVKISAETGAGGFILPNDRVDVLVTTQGGGRDHFTRTVLANVRVLAIDQSFREEGDQRVAVGKTATLELEPRQAELLAQSEAAGTVSLALRSLADINADKDQTTAPVATGAVTLLRYGSVSHVSVGGASQ
jgi:pilus assembly protein CpaB